MKYTIETTNNGCIETIELHDGSTYVKRSTRTESGCKCEDQEFAHQMKSDGICDEITEKVYDIFDGFLACDFMSVAELDT